MKTPQQWIEVYNQMETPTPLVELIRMAQEEASRERDNEMCEFADYIAINKFTFSGCTWFNTIEKYHIEPKQLLEQFRKSKES